MSGEKKKNSVFFGSKFSKPVYLELCAVLYNYFYVVNYFACMKVYFYKTTFLKNVILFG